MVLWRISRHRDLSGIGGLKAAGRWHHPGHTIVYMTETPASALLEVCVHTSANDVPPAFTLLKIEGPNMEVPSIKAYDLPKNWQAQLEATRDLGTAWL
jgi:RES domain-containing protein